METHHITRTVVHNGNLLHMHEHAHAFVHTNYCSCSNQDRAVGDGAAGATMQFSLAGDTKVCSYIYV